MAKIVEIDYSFIKTGYELQEFLRKEFQEKYGELYFHVDYETKPYKRLSIVFYNSDKNLEQYEISYAGNIAIIITGFNLDDTLTSYMSANCIKAKEIDILMSFSTQNGNITKILNYLIKKFKHLNLEKITPPKKFLFKKQKTIVEDEVIKPVIKPVIKIEKEKEIEVNVIMTEVEVKIEESPKEIIESKFCPICRKDAIHINNICQRHLIPKHQNKQYKININNTDNTQKQEAQDVRIKKIF